MKDSPEYKNLSLTSMARGPELDAVAERLMSELPERCKDCPLAFAIHCAISEADWWIPQTPRDARDILFPTEGSSSFGLPSNAEPALRSVVRMANEEAGQGPRGENNSVCCTDKREVDRATYG